MRMAARLYALSALSAILAGRDTGKGYLVFHVDQLSGERNLEQIGVHIADDVLNAVSTRMAEYANRQNETVVLGFPINLPRTPPDSVVMPYEICPPAVRNQPSISRLLEAAGRRLPAYANRYANLNLETRVSIFVTETGRPIAWVVKASSGDRDYDRVALDAAHRMEFHPAIMRGKAIP